MLSHYIDFEIRRDPEFAPGPLLDALFAKLHRRLVNLGRNDLAVAFPGYLEGRHLGRVLRLLGPQAALEDCQAADWLQGLRGHVLLSALAEVPSSARPHRLLRVQAKSGVERLRRRAMRRHGSSAEQAAERLPDEIAERLRLPHLKLRSASTGQGFLLFLKLEPAENAVAGTFNPYGLSPRATVPWF